MANLVDIAIRKKLIAQHPFFVLLKQEEVEQLACLFLEKQMNKGEIIVKVGSMTDSIYLIVSGEVEVISRIISGNHYTNLPVAVLREGEAIGLAETRVSAKEGLRTATVRALSDVTLLYIPLLEFERFFAASSLYTNMPSLFLKSKILIFLKEIEPFVTLDNNDIQWIAQRVQPVAFPAGSIIFKQGEQGDRCYFIEHGKVAIIYTDENGVENKLDTLTTQDIFGEIAVLTNSPRTATVRVVEDCKLLALHRNDLQAILNRNKNAHESIIYLLERRNRPLVHAHIKVFQEQVADGEIFWILENPKNEQFYRLTSQGWFIWQQIDGKKSVEKINRDYQEKYELDDDNNYVKKLLGDLFHQGFIEFTLNKGGLRNPKKSKRSIWRRVFNKRKHQSR